MCLLISSVLTLCQSYVLDAKRVARINSVVVIVPKVSVEAGNALALLQTGNVILMFVEIVGSGELLVVLWNYFLFFSSFTEVFLVPTAHVIVVSRVTGSC